MTTERLQDQDAALQDAGIAPDYDGERRWRFFSPPQAIPGQGPGPRPTPRPAPQLAYYERLRRGEYGLTDKGELAQAAIQAGLEAPQEPEPPRRRLPFDLPKPPYPRIPGLSPFLRSANYAFEEGMRPTGLLAGIPPLEPPAPGPAEIAGALVGGSFTQGPDLSRPDVKPWDVALSYPGLWQLQLPEQFLLKLRAQAPGTMGRIAGVEAAATRAETAARVAPYRAGYEQWAMAAKGLTQDEAKIAGATAEAFANQVERATGLPAEEYFRQARFQGVQRTAVPRAGAAPEDIERLEPGARSAAARGGLEPTVPAGQARAPQAAATESLTPAAAEAEPAAQLSPRSEDVAQAVEAILKRESTLGGVIFPFDAPVGVRPLAKELGMDADSPAFGALLVRAFREGVLKSEGSSRDLARTIRIEGRPIGAVSRYAAAEALTPAELEAVAQGAPGARPPQALIVYHGTPNLFEKFDPGRTHVESLYGPGIYFTEEKSVAIGYAKKGPTANVKQATITPRKVFDVDAPPDPELLRALDMSDAMLRPGGAPRRIYDPNNPAIVREAAKGETFFRTNRDVYMDALEGMGNKAEVNDWLVANGYDAITHIGGKARGNPHRVWIMLESEGRIQKLDTIPVPRVTSEVQALARSAPSGLTLPATETEAMAQATALGHADVDGIVVGPRVGRRGAGRPPSLPGGVEVVGGPGGPRPPRGHPPEVSEVPEPPHPPLEAPPYEKEIETIIRQWSGVQNVAEEEIKRWYQGGEKVMKDALRGQKPSEATMDRLFQMLHGEFEPDMPGPAHLADLQAYGDRYLFLYRYLVAGRDAEQARSLAFDPTMEPRFMAHPDYFPRGWQPPKGVVGGRGGIGATPSFKKPRVDATYTEMREQGWEPASWNPLAMMAERSLSGARYRGQMTLIRTLEHRGLALPWREIQEQGLEEWRVPKVGPAFEGRPIKVNNSFLRTGETAVPNIMADMLEAEAGRTPRFAVEGVNIVPAVRMASDLAKSIKLVSSFFQQIDFTTRSLATAFSMTGLRQGAPIKFPGHVLKMAQLQFVPGAVQDFRSWILSDEPIAVVKGMRGPSPRMLAEEGLGIEGDISMIRREFQLTPESKSKLGAMFGEVLQKLGVDAEGKPIRLIGAPARRLKAANEFMQKGLFDGVYMESQKFAAENFVVPLLMKAHPEWTQRQIAGAAANEINKMFSTLGIWQTVLKQPGVREVARDVLFSSNESEALIRQALSAVRGPNTRLWREYHLGLALSLAAIGNLIHYWATGRLLPAGAYNPVVINDPYSPFKVAYNRRLFSPQVPGIEGRGDTPVTLDMVGQMDSMLNIALDPMGALGARTNVLPRMIMNQANGSDFFGRKLDNPLLRAIQALEDTLLPIGGGNIVGALLPEGRYTPEGERRLGVKGQLVQATGLNLRGLPTLDLIRASIVKHGFEKPDGSPAFDMSDLSPVQLRELKKDSMLMDELTKRRDTALLHGAEGAKSSVELEKIDMERRTAIDSAAQRLRQRDMTPQDFRAAVDDAQMVAAIRKKQTLETYGLLEDSRPDDPFKAALWDYYQIFTTKGARRVDGTVDHDKLETMLGALEKQWPPMVARYVRENTGLAPTDNPDIQQFFALKGRLRDMGYWDIYKGDPDYTKDPQIMADYEAWRDAKRTGKMEEWQRSVGGSKRAQDYMERLDRREKHAHEYLRSQDPAVDLAYSRYYGGAPVLPENQARVASEEGMNRQLSVIGIESQARQALLRHGIDTIEKVAGMTEEALAELPGIGDKTAATILKRARDAASAMEKLRRAG